MVLKVTFLPRGLLVGRSQKQRSVKMQCMLELFRGRNGYQVLWCMWVDVLCEEMLQTKKWKFSKAAAQ